MLVKINNPANRFTKSQVEWLEENPLQRSEVYLEKVKSIISSNDSPDIKFTYSVNPYRGCHHGCAYCYARPTHQYINFSAGSDFETKIVVKINAAEKLKEAFLKKSWKGEKIVFSGVTDCYQPLEAEYKLTRSCLIVCNDFCNPLGIITKGALIRRDIDILQSLHQNTDLKIYISLAFSDDEMSRKIEPYAPSPSIRFKTLEALAKSGLNVGIGIAPVIPALNDYQIPEILKRAKECGANTAFMTLLRLPTEVKEVFLNNIQSNYPDRYGKVVNRIKSMRGDRMNEHKFGQRMHGTGKEWEAIEFLFNSSCEKFGLNQRQTQKEENQKGNNEFVSTFKRPTPQLSLW